MTNRNKSFKYKIINRFEMVIRKIMQTVLLPFARPDSLPYTPALLLISGTQNIDLLLGMF